MKHIFTTLGLLLAGTAAFSQTLAFHEDFEIPDSVVATGNPTWNTDNTLQTNGQKSYRNQVAAADTSWLTTNAFSTVGNTFIMLKFDQICKIEFFDFGRIEVSNDNGTTWTQLTGAEYLGTSPFGAQGNKFTSASYAVWQAASNTAVPTNAWWQSEVFDLSSLIPNAAQCKVRFKLYDGSTPNGPNGNYGWNIDNLRVEASPSELNPPVIVLNPPNYIGTVFNLGPYTINATITDQSGIASATLEYTVNSGPLQVVSMTNTTANDWVGTIPAVTDSDTVCFYVHAIDASVAANAASNPSSGCQQFVAFSGIVFPYVDNFDGSNIWTVHDSMPGQPATTWELGMPAYGATSSTHSGANAWDINLTAAYGDQAFTYLISPVFDFTNAVNTKLSFWQNFNSEPTWDGVRVEYTTDGTNWNILGVQNDPLGVNWYTSSALNATGLPGWEGNSNGWIKSEYELGILNNVVGPVQFRFVFNSDFSVTYDGYTIDDFSLVLPSPQDAGVRVMLAPNVASCIPAGNVPLTVVWKNYGTQNVVGPMDIVYQIDNNTPVTEQYMGTLTPAALDTFTFATLMNLTPGTHTIKMYTSLVNDGFLQNDTLVVTCTAVNGVTVPYYNPIETVANFNDFCATSTMQGRVQQVAAAANTGSSGMAFDATSGNGWLIFTDTIPTSPYYVWNPTVNPQQRANARLVVNTTGFNDLVLEFDAKLLYQYANEYTNFRILVNGVQVSPHLMPNYQNSNYDKYRYMLTSFLPAPYLTIDFESKVAYDYVSIGTGIFVDNVNIYQPDSLDAGVTAITAPVSMTQANQNATVTVQFRNYGFGTLTNVPIKYSVNAGPATTGTWTGTLAPNAFATYTFTTPYTSPTGQYDVCAWTAEPNDVHIINDTTCKTLTGIPVVAAPYFENFETPTAGYWGTQTTYATSWQLGNPSAPVITGCQSPSNAWEINLFGDYNNNSNEYLYTPFIDFSNVTNAELRFWNWWDCEPSWDGGRIEMSTDGGNSWNVLGAMNDPNGTDWYNTASIISSGLPAWNGTGATGYVHSMYKLTTLNNFPTPVQFRFVFTSDASVNNYDGWGVDDFEIWVPIDDSSSHIMVNSNQGSPMPLPGSNSVKMNMTNVGALPLNSIKATLEIDGSVVVTDNVTLTPPLTTGQTRQYTFSTPWMAAPGNHDIRVWTEDPNNIHDVNTLNDTTKRRVTVVDTVTWLNQNPYCFNFEQWETQKPWASMNAVTFDEKSIFEMGTPNKSVINTAANFSNAWVTNLTSDYGAADSSGLFTPVFDVVNDGGCYQIGFSTWYQTEAGHDGGIFEYSTDLGNTWTNLGAAYQTQWYNFPYITSLGGFSGTQGFSGSSNQWVFAAHLIQFQQTGKVIFRFHFGSDTAVFADGWGIDNFCFTKLPAPCYVGVDELEKDGIKLAQNIPNPASNSTTIGYTLPAAGKVTVTLHNMLGQEVRAVTSEDNAGEHRVIFNLEGLPDGIYSYALTYNDKEVLVKKMTITH